MKSDSVHERTTTPPPQMTEELRRKIDAEVREIREEFHLRVEKMWRLPLEERLGRSR